MNSENDLMQRLMISKKIMDRHNQMDKSGEKPRGNTYDVSAPMVEDYQPVSAQYNIPQEFMTETKQIPNPTTPAKDRILSSKLPDEIKKIMIENPIVVPNMGIGNNVGITNELAEKAARLMNVDAAGKSISQQPQNKSINENISDNGSLRNLLKEVVTEILQENGLLIESQSKSNDTFSFKVGQHIFEGKVTKIKKVKNI